MVSEFFAAFLGTLGGLTVALAAVRVLSANFIEHQLAKALAQHQHGLDQQLTHLSTELNRVSDVLSRRNEREFGVTEGVWERMIRALGTAQGQLGQGKSVPVFRFMAEDEAQLVIEALEFEDWQKAELRQAGTGERDELYTRFDFAHGVRESFSEWAEFKNYLSTRQIFLSKPIHDGFAQIRDELQKILVKANLYVNQEERMPVQDRAGIGRLLAIDLNEKVDDLAIIIRRRFGFDDNA